MRKWICALQHSRMTGSGTILLFRNDSPNGISRKKRALSGCVTGIAGQQKIGCYRPYGL